MKLHFEKDYESITSLNTTSDILPRFMVITGRNGTGKTHLLKAIDDGHIRATDDTETVLESSYFSYLNLVPVDANTSAAELESEKRKFFTAWERTSGNLKQNTSDKIVALITNEYKDISIDNNVIDVVANGRKEELLDIVSQSERNQGLSEEEIESVVNKVCEDGKKEVREFSKICINNIENTFLTNQTKIANNSRVTKKQVISHDDTQINTVFQELNRKKVKASSVLKNIEEKSEKSLFTIDRDTFFRSYPKEIHANPLQRSFSLWFTRYIAEFRSNSMRKAFVKDSEEEGLFLTDAEFIEKHGIYPWEFTQDVLDEAGISLKVNTPSLEDGEEFFRATFQHAGTGNTVRLDALSSGEKIILSLVLAFSQVPIEDIAKDHCNLLLLDEIDASLHPSLTQYLFTVLNKVLKHRDDMHIVLVTHSPSTIALSDETSVYRLKSNGSDKTLEKCSKDEAISTLTKGVPTLSINHENRRQIFVESEFDAQNFELLNEKLADYVPSDLSVNFISTGKKKTDGSSDNEGCDRVKTIVKSLVEVKAQNIYGLIDWDLGNEEDENLFVLAHDTRYSIENCLLDPLLLTTLLIREGQVPVNFELPDGTNYIQLSDLTQDQWQKAIDIVVKKVEVNVNPANIPELKDKTDLVKCSYLGGMTLEIPRWYLEQNGHSLEDKVKETFRELKRFNNPNKLLEFIVSQVIADFPDFTPIEIMNTLRQARGLEILDKDYH